MKSLFNFTLAEPLHIAQNLFGSGAATVAGPSGLDKVMGILNTPAGGAMIQAAGAGIGAYGANKSATADRNLRAQQFAAEMAQRQNEQDRAHQLNSAQAATAASPLGAEQSFAQKQALLRAILGNTQNFSATPGDPSIAAAMGSTNQGGMRIPEAGFNPAMLERMFGDKTTMGSIANRQQAIGQLNPRQSAMNLGSMFGDAGTAASQGVLDANQMELQRQMDASAAQRSQIQRAIDEDIRGEKQGGSSSSKGSKLGNAAKGALGGAGTGFMFGGPVGAAIGGVGGFLKGLF
jgi:hypothetical protein